MDVAAEEQEREQERERERERERDGGRDGRDGEAALREGREAQRTFRQEMTARLDKLTENVDRLALAYERLAAASPTRKDIQDAADTRVSKDTFEGFRTAINDRLTKLEQRPDAARGWILLALTAFNIAGAYLIAAHR